MTNKILGGLGLSILAFLMIDFGLSISENTLFLAQKFVFAMEQKAIWR